MQMSCVTCSQPIGKLATSCRCNDANTMQMSLTICKLPPERRIVDDRRFGTDITGHFRHDDRPFDDGRAIRNLLRLDRFDRLDRLDRRRLRRLRRFGLRAATSVPRSENRWTRRRKEPQSEQQQQYVDLGILFQDCWWDLGAFPFGKWTIDEFPANWID